MTRRLVQRFVLIYVLSLAAVGVWLIASSPGPPWQEISGVGIGRYEGPGGIVHISGRRLSCEALPATAAYAERCTIMIAGKPLVVDARRSDRSSMNQLGGTCAATYDGRSWACDLGSRHVHTHWYAFIYDPLGLEPPELDALRRRYVLENLPANIFLPGVLVVGLTTALLTLAVCVYLMWSLFSRPMAVAVSTASAGIVFMWSLVAGLFAVNGFWD